MLVQSLSYGLKPNLKSCYVCASYCRIFSLNFHLILKCSILGNKLNPTVNIWFLLCYSYVRGYGEGWLWRHNEHWHFVNCNRNDEKEMFTHSTVEMYPEQMYFTLLWSIRTMILLARLKKSCFCLKYYRQENGCQTYGLFSGWIIWMCYR